MGLGDNAGLLSLGGGLDRAVSEYFNIAGDKAQGRQALSGDMRAINRRFRALRSLASARRSGIRS